MIYALFGLVFIGLSAFVIFILSYYSDASHFDDAVSAYFDPEYKEKEPMTVDYKGKRYYPNDYETAAITDDACRGGITTRTRQFFVDEEDYAECDKVVINYGDMATMTFYSLPDEGDKDAALLKYERDGKTTYYKIVGLEAINNILANIRLVNK